MRTLAFHLLAMAASAGMAFGTPVALAQDTRQVTEPKVPPACATLAADKFVGADRAMAEADERRLDSRRIQEALGACGAGKAVRLVAGPAKGAGVQPLNAFLSGPLSLPAGVTLVVDKSVTLFGSRNPADYDYPDAPGICGTTEQADRPFVSPPASGQVAANPAIRPNVGQATPSGCRPLLSIANAKHAGIMGEGTIDGRGDMQLIGHDFSWWQMARKAETGNKRYYSGRLIVATHADGLVLYGITLHNSPNFHVSVNQTDGFTAWGVHLLTPTVKGTDARNTDGIDPGSSTNVTVAHSWIDNGDDNIAIKTGVSHMSVLHNHFYNGHGMSIGSETNTGDSFLLVDDLVEDHTTSGIRIKSNVTRGGLVHDMVYRNICMRDVQVPIAISPYYNNGTIDQFFDPGFKGDRIPDYKAITIEHVTDLTAGDVLIAGFDEAHRTQVSLVDVTIQGITPAQVHARFADVVTAGSNIPFEKTGGNKDVRVVTVEGRGAPYSCDGKFVPMR